MRKVPVVAGLMFGLLVFAASLLFLSRPVSAHSGDVLSAFTTVTPTIDGVISPGEWDDADTVNFELRIPQGTPVKFHDSTLYVKNDATNLYLAWVIVEEVFATPALVLARFHFDNDHDGVREVGDDAINCFINAFTANCNDEYLTSVVNFNEQGDTADGGTTDILGALSHTNPVIGGNGVYTIEVSHPLDTADDSHDFSLSPGETVGFFLEFFESGLGAGVFPSFFANSFADIVIARQVEQVAIDINPGSFPNDINQSSGGVIPVAILGSDTFDATAVDGSTCTLGTAEVKVVGKSDDKLLCSDEDVSGPPPGPGGASDPSGTPDGFIDKVCKFVTIDLGSTPGDTTATIHCSAPEEIEGTDSIRIVPPE